MKIHECFISLFGGLGLFIAAMNIMSSNLQKVAGAGMRRLLAKITDNRFAGVGIGAIVTIDHPKFICNNSNGNRLC